MNKSKDIDLKSSEVANKVGISVVTLSNWYKWFYDLETVTPKDCPGLPEFKQSGFKQPRYWRSSDIEQIKKFKNWIPHGRSGVMGRVSEKFWGTRKKKED